MDWLRHKIKINSNKNRDNFKLSQDKLRIDEMKKRFSKNFKMITAVIPVRKGSQRVKIKV